MVYQAKDDLLYIMEIMTRNSAEKTPNKKYNPGNKTTGIQPNFPFK